MATVPKLTLSPTSDSRTSSRNLSRAQSPIASSIISQTSGPHGHHERDVSYNYLVYRHISVDIGNSSGKLDKKQWKSIVSFDTVVQDTDGLGRSRSRSRSRSRARSSSRSRARSSSRSRSLERGYLTAGDLTTNEQQFQHQQHPQLLDDDDAPIPIALSKKINLMDGLKRRIHLDVNEDGARQDYPTSAAFDGNAFTLRLKHKGQNQVKSDLKPRHSRWLVYLTGRMHTWVGLDYVVDKLLQDGDELIIVSRVPKMFLDEYDYDETEAMFKETVERIADYVHNICNPKLSFKLNIDIFIHEHTKKTLAETIAIYEPHLLVVVNKPNSRFLEPSSWNMTSRLSHKILKDFAIPVIIVPALTTNEYELEFFEKICKEKGWKLEIEIDDKKAVLPDSKLEKMLRTRLQELKQDRSQASLESLSRKHTHGSMSTQSNDDDDDNSISSDSESIDSVSDDPFIELTELVKMKRGELRSYFEDVRQKPMKRGIFEDNLLKVSDAIADVAAKMKEASENGDVTELVRSITGMPQLSKTKSMLDVIEPSRDPINKIKNQLSHSTTNSPLMTPTPPQPSSLKWNLDLPDRSKVSVNSTNSDLRRIKSNASNNGSSPSPGSRSPFHNNLQASVSHDTGTTQRRAKLHKSKSESVVPTNSNSRGSKKFSLKSLFGKK
ncbi:CYFA0S19e02036g1_1 [Cyberlindnera fabianii]|uniref:CYFA0S19e02036g1_1 n=1 Tax=Cyberlindnera fabianii TaxID=36022 RepID=A0A061BCV8_CYBFA|nr:CYFA0S19e02036g1_1 [Cyberlindnera fabianii]